MLNTYQRSGFYIETYQKSIKSENLNTHEIFRFPNSSELYIANIIRHKTFHCTSLNSGRTYSFFYEKLPIVIYQGFISNGL